MAVLLVAVDSHTPPHQTHRVQLANGDMLVAVKWDSPFDREVTRVQGCDLVAVFPEVEKWPLEWRDWLKARLARHAR